MVSRMDGGQVVHQGTQRVDRDVVVAQFQKAAEKVAQKAPEGERIPADEVKFMTDGLNKFLAGSSTELRFEYHEELKEYYVTIVDSGTHKVVKEIPSKKLLDAHAAMMELNGLFVNYKI